MTRSPLHPTGVTCAETGTYCPTPKLCTQSCRYNIKRAAAIRPRGKSILADSAALIELCAQSNFFAAYDARGLQTGTMSALAVASTLAQVIGERDDARKMLAEALALLRAARQIAKAADDILARGSKQ